MGYGLVPLDRLVELVAERGGRVRATEAASLLFALHHAPEGLACSLLRPLVEGDDRLTWRGAHVALAADDDPALELARFVVFDLETTGLAGPGARICEIGAVEIRALEPAASFQTLVAPGTALPAAVERLTGLSDELLAGAPPVEAALERFAAFSAGAVLVAHNARFDVGFVDRELGRLRGQRLTAPVVDTLSLARRLLAGRLTRTSLASLAFFFGTSVEPCHRALPDAQATAEVFLRLVELAREQGAARLSELEELAAPRPRRIYAKRRLVDEAPSCPGVYLFHDADGRVLYVGKARDLRTRLRSYFHTPRQRPALESALERVVRIGWRTTGSELAAELEEVRLIRRLRPPANARTPSPERYVFLHRRGARIVVSRAPSRYGPVRRELEARRAARALAGCSEEEFERLLEGEVLLRLGHELGQLSLAGHDLELRRRRRELASLERVVAQLTQVERLGRLTACLLAPALEPESLEVFVVHAGRLSQRVLPTRADLEQALAELVAPPPGAPQPARVSAEALDELLVVASRLASPPPELTVLPLARAA